MLNRPLVLALAVCFLGLGAAKDLPAQESAYVSLAEASVAGPIRFRISHGADVPYRAFVLADPPRLVIDRAGSAIAGIEKLSVTGVREVRVGRLDQTWHRTIISLAGPMLLTETVPKDGDLTLVLRPTGAKAMAQEAKLAPPVPGIAPLAPPPVADGRVRVVIDPGHGGIDPGARRDGVEEKDLTLSMALRLTEELSKTGQYEVLLTRNTDRFVLLDDRVAFGRRAGAALFISLHANTVAVGDATGATVHILARGRSDPEAAALAIIENRSDAAAGLAPVAADDITKVLHDMARPVTETRAKEAAERIVTALRNAGITLHRRPLKGADFRVLRAPDMPSVLIELGFLSNEAERARLGDPAWQTRVAQALAEAVDGWIAADRAFLTLMRE